MTKLALIAALALLAAAAFSQQDTRVVVGPVPQQVTDTSAALWWVTAVPNKSQLIYGTAPNQLNKEGMEDASDPLIQHHAVLTALQPDTTYYYAVRDNSSQPNVSGQFSTEPQGYMDHGVWLSNGPVLEYLDSSSAVIAWSTNVNSSTLVRYSQDPTNMNKNAQEKWGQRTHRVILKDLRPNAVYYFVVESGQGQGSGAMAKSNVARFRTLRQGEKGMRDLALKPK